MSHATRPLAALAIAASFALPLPAAAQEPPDYHWLAARYEWTTFDDATSDWHHASAEYGRRTPVGTLIGRANWAERSGNAAPQVELDAYPVWPGFGYAYLSIGYATDLPFPDLRLAGELYVSLPRAWEASLGVVRFDFDDDDVNVIVGSLSHYVGNYWIALRPQWLPEGDDYSVTALARRYFSGPDDWITARLTYGTTSDEIVTQADIVRLRTLGASVQGRVPLGERWRILPEAGVFSEELPGDRERLRVSLGIGLLRRF